MIGRRILAFWVDLFLAIFLTSAGLWLLRQEILRGTDSADLFNPLRAWAEGRLHPVVWIVGLFLYFFLFLSANSETPGLTAFGLTAIRNADEDGRQRIGTSRALARTILLAGSALFFGAGFLPVFFNDRRLALHDCLSGTRIVRVRSRVSRPAETS